MPLPQLPRMGSSIDDCGSLTKFRGAKKFKGNPGEKKRKQTQNNHRSIARVRSCLHQRPAPDSEPHSFWGRGIEGIGFWESRFTFRYVGTELCEISYMPPGEDRDSCVQSCTLKIFSLDCRTPLTPFSTCPMIPAKHFVNGATLVRRWIPWWLSPAEFPPELQSIVASTLPPIAPPHLTFVGGESRKTKIALRSTETRHR